MAMTEADGRLRVVGRSNDDAKFLIDGRTIPFVAGMSLSMTAGQIPSVVLDLRVPHGVDLDIPGVKVTAVVKSDVIQVTWISIWKDLLSKLGLRIS